ncbi:sugar-transfer associated ATP-grasp domain-containing protein, partial [Seonamhaeicola sp.]|uniref:sugar-transfer associated ATP-grasp domain-containing protein n=1 Tax=Seonamhaeicola sp. TaxID=1912245 RepID=UPI003563C518
MLTRVLLIKGFFKDPDKKSVFKIIYELFVYGWAKKEFPTDYFRKFLYRKGVTNITSYLSLKEFYSIIDSKKILVPDIASILESKLSFSMLANKHNLPTPQIMSYNIGRNFYLNSKHYSINSKNELIDFFTKVFTCYKEPALFLKPINGIGGKGCILLSKEQFKLQIEDCFDTLLKHNYLHQEKIVQHPIINKIHPNAINTLRINTYLDTDGKSHIISALMRFGSGNLVTDNESSGGFYIALDIENKALKGIGRQ